MAEPAELIIFDCDGVLVDSEPIAARIEVQALAEIGWRLSEDELVRRFMGRSNGFMLAEVERHIGGPLPAGFADLVASRQHAAFVTELRPVAGVVPALDAITTPTCVASSGSQRKMRGTLGITGLYSRFAGRIFSADQVSRGKPAPDLFLFAAEQLGVPADRCAVVEDSRYGVQAARAAGMRVFGYAGGLTPPSWLVGPGTVVFDDMRELPGLLAA